MEGDAFRAASSKDREDNGVKKKEIYKNTLSIPLAFNEAFERIVFPLCLLLTSFRRQQVCNRQMRDGLRLLVSSLLWRFKGITFRKGQPSVRYNPPRGYHPPWMSPLG